MGSARVPLAAAELLSVRLNTLAAPLLPLLDEAIVPGGGKLSPGTLGSEIPVDCLLVLHACGGRGGRNLSAADAAAAAAGNAAGICPARAVRLVACDMPGASLVVAECPWLGKAGLKPRRRLAPSVTCFWYSNPESSRDASGKLDACSHCCCTAASTAGPRWRSKPGLLGVLPWSWTSAFAGMVKGKGSYVAGDVTLDGMPCQRPSHTQAGWQGELTNCATYTHTYMQVEKSKQHGSKHKLKPFVAVHV